MSAQTLFRAGAALTATGMSFGAFGAHGLRSKYPDMADKSINSWMTGSSYMIYNGIALLALSAHPAVALGARRYRTAAGLIVGGALTFSGTIFGLVLFRDKVGKVFGPLTPMGGLVMIAGYIALAL